MYEEEMESSEMFGENGRQGNTPLASSGLYSLRLIVLSHSFAPDSFL